MYQTSSLPYWIFSLALLFLWIYVASCFSNDVFFNLYVNRVRTWLFRPVTWVQNIAPKCPEWMAAAILLVLLLLLRGALAKAVQTPIDQSFGDTVLVANMASFGKTAIFAALSLLLLICKINIIRMVMRWRFGEKTRSSVVECLDTATAPLSYLPLKYSAIATAVSIFAVSAAMMFVAGGIHTPPGPIAGGVGIYLALKLAFFAIADVLLLLRTVIIAIFIVQIVGILSSNRTAIGMAGEWFNEISRVFVTRPVIVGLLDLTPLIAMLLLGFAHGIVITLVNGIF